MSNCLRNAIGVRDCNTTITPLVYLNSLPGLSMKSLDMIADEDKQTYLGVIDAISERASNRLLNDFYVNAGIQLKVYNDVSCFGRFEEPLTYNPPLANPALQGVMFTFRQSKYLVLNVFKIYWRSLNEQDITFYVKDYFTGDLIEEKTFHVMPGENELLFNSTFAPLRHRNKLFIGYDASTTGWYSTQALPCWDLCYCDYNNFGVCGCASSYICSNVYSYAGMINNNTDTYGISLQFSTECSLSKLVCDNVGLFTQSLLYAAGVEYLHEVTMSPRLNKYTTNKKEEIDKMLNIFEKRYNDSLAKSTKNIDFCDDCCFECNGGIQYKYAKP